MQREDRKISKDFKNNFECLPTVLIDSKLGKFSLLIQDTFGDCEFLKYDFEAGEVYVIFEF
jgi:hypothetical protein